MFVAIYFSYLTNYRVAELNIINYALQAYSLENLTQTIEQQSWTSLSFPIFILLAFSIMFVTIYSSYKTNCRIAELNIINYALQVDSDDILAIENSPDSNVKMADYWLKTAIVFKDGAEQRAFSAQMAIVAVYILVFLLIVSAPLPLSEPMFQFLLICFAVFITSLALLVPFRISPKSRPFLDKITIILSKIDAHPNINKVFEDNIWLMKYLCEYMDAERRKKDYFGLCPQKREKLWESYKELLNQHGIPTDDLQEKCSCK